MSVTTRDLRKLVAGLYPEVHCHIKDNHVCFKLTFGAHHCYVYVCMFSSPVATDLVVSLFPVDKTGKNIMYNNLSLSQIGAFYGTLQPTLDSVTTSIFAYPDEPITVSLDLSVELPGDEGIATFKETLRARLHETIEKICEQFRNVAPVIHAFARGTMTLEEKQLWLMSPANMIPA